MWQVWLIISGVCFILEILTVGFLIFWFGIGAILAMLVSFFTNNLIIQTTVFIVSSTLLLFLTKPLVKKVSHSDKLKTNAYSIIGKKGIVTKEIDSQKGLGQIKVGTETWSAKSFDDTTIAEGTQIDIISINGVKAIVQPTEVLITK